MKPKTRIKAHANGPIRSGAGYQIGFYDVGILREALEHSGEDFYRVGSLPIPQNAVQFNQIQAIINHPSIQYAIVDKDKIVICQIGNNTEWLSIINDMGYIVEGGGKTPKRVKSFHRSTLLNAKFDLDEINILTVECAQYSRYFEPSENGSDFVLKDADSYVDYLQDPETWERLIDGGFAIRPWLIERAIENLPVFDLTQSNDNGDYFLNPTLRSDLIKDLRNAKTFNIRLFGPQGLLKGNCIVTDQLPEGVDVVTWHGNIKSEIKYTKGYRLLAEPQTAKSKVRTDDQTVINMPQLFTKANMEYWLDEEYTKMFNDAINNKLLMNWRNVYLRSFHDDSDIEDEESFARFQYVGYRWKAMGMKITDSPWLFKTLAISHAKPLENKIPIPCAVSEQIISESMARLCGYDIEVEEGTIRRLNDIKVHVVNDLDWMEMYESHGGCDHDDFFSLFYRTFIGGQYDQEKVVVVKRSPNGFGEYSIFRYVEGEWFPTWKTSDGQEHSFLEVSGRGWPQRLSVAIRADKVNYVGLPSNFKPKPVRSETYTRQDVFEDIKATMRGGGVGGFVNATMLHAAVFHKHREYQLCSLEDAIDGCTQTYDSADRDAIEEETKSMVREVIDSGLPVDRSLWESKSFKYYLKPGEWVEKTDGKITQLNRITRTKYNQYIKKVDDWSKENCNPNPQIMKMGTRLRLHATTILNDFRQGTAETNADLNAQQNGFISRTEWEYLYQKVVDAIESYQMESDRHDMILGLYAASFTKPTTNGNISDQLIMNRIIFPYLEKALQYYGLANTVSFVKNSDGAVRVVQSCVKEWRVEMTNGEYAVFTDPAEYQRFRSKQSPIVFSRRKLA